MSKLPWLWSYCYVALGFCGKSALLNMNSTRIYCLVLAWTMSEAPLWIRCRWRFTDKWVVWIINDSCRFMINDYGGPRNKQTMREYRTVSKTGASSVCPFGYSFSTFLGSPEVEMTDLFALFKNIASRWYIGINRWIVWKERHCHNNTSLKAKEKHLKYLYEKRIASEQES